MNSRRLGAAEANGLEVNFTESDAHGTLVELKEIRLLDYMIISWYLGPSAER